MRNTVTRPSRASTLTGTLLTGFAFCLIWLSGCAGVPELPPGEPGMEGRVTEEGKGASGAEVALLPPQFHLSGELEPVARALSEPDGTFRLSAPEGVYLVTARKGDRFAYFGRNPVRLGSRLTGLHLPLVAAHPVARAPVPPGEEALAGRVLHRGQPVTGARVFVYLDPSRGLRGPGYAVSDPTGPDGAYRIPLPPGTYFVATRYRSGGWRPGALEPGDLFGVLPEFPLALRGGETVRVDVETVALPSRKQMARFQGGFAQITGTIVDANGVPQAGMRACLYTNPQMLDRPLGISEPTGKDGKFAIQNVRAGFYYLGAREMLGGPPVPGERVGFYRGPRGAAVELGRGERLQDLAVVTQAVP